MVFLLEIKRHCWLQATILKEKKSCVLVVRCKYKYKTCTMWDVKGEIFPLSKGFWEIFREQHDINLKYLHELAFTNSTATYIESKSHMKFLIKGSYWMKEKSVLHVGSFVSTHKLSS